MRFSLFVLLTMLFLLSVSPAEHISLDAPETSAENPCADLLSRGYPQQLLDRLLPAVKQSLLDAPDLFYAGAMVVACDPVTGAHSTLSLLAEDDFALEQAPADDLVFTLVFSGNRRSDMLVDVKCCYRWTTLPLLRAENFVSLSWDRELFALQGGFYKADFYDDYRVVGREIIPVQGTVHDESTYFAETAASHAGWYMERKGASPARFLLALYGFCEFGLRRISSSSPIFPAPTLRCEHVAPRLVWQDS